GVSFGGAAPSRVEALSYLLSLLLVGSAAGSTARNLIRMGLTRSWTSQGPPCRAVARTPLLVTTEPRDRPWRRHPEHGRDIGRPPPRQRRAGRQRRRLHRLLPVCPRGRRRWRRVVRRRRRPGVRVQPWAGERWRGRQQLRRGCRRCYRQREHRR